MKTLLTFTFGLLCGLSAGMLINSPAALILTELAPQGPQSLQGMSQYAEDLNNGFRAITGQLTGLQKQEPRIWTNINGNTVRGTLERVGRDTVTIHTSDRRFVSVPIEQLCLRDRVFVRLQQQTVNQ